uniref:Putative conserved secreted protein n=1 Tax=Panstrongylus lignarius TaxID=156445 RepID=A0A224XRE8_9HEMI
MPPSFLVFSTLVLLNMCLLHIAHGRDPSLLSIIAGMNDECKEKEHVETLCQTCAKRTKSNIVYPMCCYGQEGAKEWCVRYTNYGKQPVYYGNP